MSFKFLEASVSDSIRPLEKDTRGIWFTYENDLFARTDRYYSQGYSFEFKHPVLKKSPVSKLLLKQLDSGKSVYGIAFRQDVYTPKSIRNTSLDSTDRPYAANVFLSQTLVSTGFSNRITTSIDVGFIGPIAFGEQQQKFIHKHTNNAEPIGWENQVVNGLIANYNLRLEHGFILTKWLDVFGDIGGKAGLLHTNATGGLIVRAGKKRDNLIHRLPKPQPNWELYTTINGTANYVVYNAVLQGLPWQHNPHVLQANKIEHLVYKLNAGLTLTVKNVSFTYVQVFITPEIKGGWQHSWGSCNIIFLF